MPRPHCPRYVSARPYAVYFKPAGIPAHALQEVVLELDELEALRLADLEGLYQAQAAETMRVSRATFGRILESAHRKVAEALVLGKALELRTGPNVVLPVDHGRRQHRGRHHNRGEET